MFSSYMANYNNSEISKQGDWFSCIVILVLILVLLFL